MPLGPDVCIRLDQGDEPIALRRAERQVERLNLRSYGWAERFVYGRRRQLLEELHHVATEEPERVEHPKPNPQVVLEEADPHDPDVGAEHPPGWPRGLWVEDDDGGERWCSYYLVHE
jgi:hypothetical protein